MAERIAVIIPCHNEATSVGKVVRDFRAALPEARIIAIDNDSQDETARLAGEAGAEVLIETRRGKGFALVRGFREAKDADILIMVDGDDTYPAEDAPLLVAALRDGADMTIGTRLETFTADAYPAFHHLGNRIFALLVRILFGVRTTDLFSGYRAMTRRFLEQCPLIAQGFEVETELSLQALVGHFKVREVPIHYRARPAGSRSKLRTTHDGARILIAMLAFFRDYRPLTCFGLVSLFLASLGLIAGLVVTSEYLRTGLVLRIPLAILSVGLLILSGMSAIAGLILSSVSRRANELAALIARR